MLLKKQSTKKLFIKARNTVEKNKNAKKLFIRTQKPYKKHSLVSEREGEGIMRDTHIFLRKQAGAVLLLVLTLSFVSCQSSEENTYLEYGQVKWGMMPEEVLELLEVSSENIVTQDVAENVEYYLLENIEFGGEKTSQLALNFMDTAGAVGLVEIYAYYPENTDMEKVKKEMKRIYGDSIPEVYEYGRSSISPEQIQEDVIKESETVKVWGGPKLSQVLEEEAFSQYRELRFPSPMEMQEETWERFRENARLVTGEWVNLPGEGGKAVHFDGYNLAVYKKVADGKGE